MAKEKTITDLKVMPKGQFPSAHENLKERLFKLAIRNDDLNEQLCSRLEQLCEMKEQAISNANMLIATEEDLLADHLRD